MAYESPSFSGTFLASTGLRQYQFVNINSNGRLANPSTAGRCVGVLISSGTTGASTAGDHPNSPQTVQFYGIAKILAGTTGIAAGDIITAATDGRGSTRVAGDHQVGLALEAVGTTSTSAQVISVLLLHAGATAAI